MMDFAPEEIMQGAELPPAPMEQLGPLPLDQEVPLLQEAFEGDCKARVRDVTDVFLPPGCTNIKRASWYCVRDVVECNEAARRFPAFAAFIKPDSAISTDRTTRQALGPYNSTTGGVEDLTNHVEIRQFHERPTEAYLMGRMLTVIGDLLVEEKEEPAFVVGMKRFSLFTFGFDPVEGELYCDAPLTHMIPRQKELNILETQLREGIQLGLRKKVLVPLMSRINVEELTSDSVQVIAYNNTQGEPRELSTSDLPQGVWNRKADLMADLRTLASVTESEQGIMGTDPNGRAAAIINAEADQQVGPIVRRNNSEFRELHRAILLFYRYFAHPDRAATIIGKEGAQTVSFLKLTLLQDGWDIVMNEEDSLARNPAVRYQQVLELFQTTTGQYFMDPMTGMVDWKKFNRMARLPDGDTGYDTEAVERATASQIPELMKMGIMWQPKSYDMPQWFAEELSAWLRGPGRQEDPMLVAQIEQIWQFYEMAKMSGMGQMMGGMQQPGSQPGQPMSATGGTPNGMSSVMGASNVSSEAQGQVQNADAAGEQAAQQALLHEN